MAPRVTPLLLTASVFITALVQTQRIAPSSLALPGSLSAALAEPWRLIGTFCYSDGFTFGYLLRLHVLSCVSYTVEHACISRKATNAANRSPILLHGSALYAAILVISFGLIGGAAGARPSELAVPFMLGSTTLFLCYVACRLPRAPASTGVGVPSVRWLSYAILLGSAMVYGATSSMHLLGAIGAGVLFESLDVLPKAPPSTPALDTGVPSTARGRRTGATVCLLGLALLTHAVPMTQPVPLLPHAHVMTIHGKALAAAANLLEASSPPSPPTASGATVGGNLTRALDFFTSLASATNLTLPPRILEATGASSSPNGRRSSKPLGVGGLLKLYQYTADHWSSKLAHVRSPPSKGNLRAKGGGAAEEEAVSEEQAAEMERLLSDALTRTDFASTTSDRDVLKAIMRTLTPTQASTMARMPRERILNTISAHRDSHRVAHEALARLGTVLAEFAGAPLADVAQAKGKGAAEPKQEDKKKDKKGAKSVKVEVKPTGDAGPAEGDAADSTTEAAEEETRPLADRLVSGLNETLSLFAVPLEMTDDEVVHELLAGTSTEASMPAAHRSHLKALTLETRELILQRFISASVKELRSILLAIAPPADDDEKEAADDKDKSGGAATPVADAPRAALNSSEHAEALELVVDLLLHHDVEPTNTDAKNVDDLYELLELKGAKELPAGTKADSTGSAGGGSMAEAADEKAKAAEAEAAQAEAQAAFAKLSGKDRPSATRPGTGALLLAAAVEWRRQKGVQEAASQARKLLLAEIENEVDTASAGTAKAVSAANAIVSADANATKPRNGAVATGPLANLTTLLETGLAGYDVPSTMSDDEVLIEYLQLLSLEQTSLTRAAKQWLQAAIVSYRRGLADALAANATSAANTTNATAGSTNKTAAASARSGPSLPPLLTALDRSLTVRALLDEESAYPLPRARSTVFAAEDFAVVMASVLQAYGVHSRVAVLCSLPTGATSGAAYAATIAAVGASGSAAEDGAAAASESKPEAAVRFCRSPAELSSEACRVVADAARSALRAPSKCRTRVEARLGKGPKKMAGWVASHRRMLRSQGKREIKGAKTLHYSTDSDGYIWLPLTYHPLAGVEQVPGGPYPENVTLAIHFPLPLPAGGAPPAFALGGGGVDSNGRRLPGGGGAVGSVLSTM